MQRSFLIATLSSLLIFYGCGGDSGTVGGTTGGSSSTPLSNVSGLPKATDAVESSSGSSSLESGIFKLEGTATTGRVLMGGEAFTSDMSPGACKTTATVAELLYQASTPDNIACYLGAMQEAGIGSHEEGDWNYMQLENLGDVEEGASPDEAETPLIKYRLTKNSAGVVTNFTMFACFSAASDGSAVQSEYIHLDIGETATIKAKHVGTFTETEGDWAGVSNFGSSVDVSGELNTNGSWASKVFEGFTYYGFTAEGTATVGDEYTMGATINQYVNDLSIMGYQNGSFSFADGSDTYQDSFDDTFYAKAQILGADSLTTFAIGDGSVSYSLSGSFKINDETPDTWSETGEESWLGDTQALLDPASDGVFYDDVNGVTPETAGTATAITFEGDEAWDCTLPEGEDWVSADFVSAFDTQEEAIEFFETKFGTCDELYGGNGGWIDCSATYDDFSTP